MSENNVPKKRGRKPKNKNTEIIQVNNQPQVKTISLAKADNTQDILNAISNGETVELDVDKQVLLNNFTTWVQNSFVYCPVMYFTLIFQGFLFLRYYFF